MSPGLAVYRSVVAQADALAWEHELRGYDADVMSAQAGYPAPAYGFAGRGSKRRREEYLAAVKRGYLEDYLPLARFFEAAVLRRGAGR